MDKKANFLWIYLIVLLSAAMFTILIAALSQWRLIPEEVFGESELEKLQAFNQTAQQNIASLISENNNYKEQVKGFEETIEALNTQAAELEGINEKLRLGDVVLRARGYYTSNKLDLCANELREINPDGLTESARVEYDNLARLLLQRGYKIN